MRMSLIFLVLLLIHSCINSETCNVVVGTDLYNREDLEYYGQVVEIEEQHKFPNGLKSKAVKIHTVYNPAKDEWDAYDTLIYAFAVKSCS